MTNAPHKILPLALTLLSASLFALLLSTSVLAEKDTIEIAASDEESKKPEDFKTLKNPVANTKKSIGRGKMLFVRACTECHGPDGKALIDVVADATDLTMPKYWYSGSEPGEIFRSIRDGAGETMPPFKMTIRNEEDMWHMVNFIQSLWPKAMRPAVVEEESTPDNEES